MGSVLFVGVSDFNLILPVLSLMHLNVFHLALIKLPGNTSVIPKMDMEI